MVVVVVLLLLIIIVIQGLIWWLNAIGLLVVTVLFRWWMMIKVEWMGRSLMVRKDAGVTIELRHYDSMWFTDNIC